MRTCQGSLPSSFISIVVLRSLLMATVESTDHRIGAFSTAYACWESRESCNSESQDHFPVPWNGDVFSIRASASLSISLRRIDSVNRRRIPRPMGSGAHSS